jgi:hypothetical protein
LDKENRAQGVDIDYDALVVAHRRISRTKKGARLIQSAQHSSNGKVRVVDVEGGLPEDSSMDEANRSINSGASTPTSTWDNGAASDRFERRFLAKKAKAQLAEAKSRASTPERKKEESPLDEDVLTLLHADVLSLPLDGIDVELPDLVYAGNYALSYFHDRKSLLGYLQQCRRTLRTETGVLIVDPFAGPTNWEPSNDDERREQDDLWSQFASESGFLRSEQDDPPVALKGDDLEFWKAKQPSTSGSDWRAWPRGRLILVRSGHLNGGYEYWREDGPIDYTTNRFRMSLSFRFTKDKSWARDYFSYDFRVWSLREITEAMEEVGFERIEVHAIPRLSSQDDVHSQKSDTSDTDSDNGIDEDEEMSKADGNHNDGMDGKNGLMQRTEKQESGKITFQHLEPDQKLFAAKSFGSEYRGGFI